MRDLLVCCLAQSYVRTSTGGKDRLTFWDFVNFLLAEQSFKVENPSVPLIPSSETLAPVFRRFSSYNRIIKAKHNHPPLEEMEQNLKFFSLKEALQQVEKQLPAGFRKEEFLGKLREHYELMDISHKGIVTKNQSRDFVWITTKGCKGPTPEKMPPTMEEQVNTLMSSCGGTDYFTFWDFANFMLSGEAQAHAQDVLVPQQNTNIVPTKK